MAGRIPKGFIDDLIARADIVEIIGERVPLKKAGREYKACCPFHDEKTPSFWVSPDKQFYHCFGCGAHGTALGFLVEYDRLPFPEAVEDLATRLGLTVPHEGGATHAPGGVAAPQPAALQEPLYALLAQVADYYHEQLPRSTRASAYLAARGLGSDIIERFRIGYAADSWNELLRRFGGSGTGEQGLKDAGLIIERERGEGCYDRFRDRIMFPIRDTRGRVIAFGGRVLDTGEPKYLNSPETALFHKGRELYGLYETRLARQSLRRLLIVEGYMDTVRLHQAGIACAVATLGTATTPDHLRRALRIASEIVFAFDGDRAGRAAAARALQTVLPEARAGREARFLFLPEGEDPDSLVGREGAAAFEARLTGALPLSEYLVTWLSEQADVSHADGKARFVALAQPLLERVAPGVYQELLFERVAAALALSPERLRQWIASPASAGGAAAPRKAARESPRSGRGTLMTQAINLVLHFPRAASAVSDEQRRALAGLPHPGIVVLRDLLEELAVRPAGTMAQTLERWRERPEYPRLCELAASAPLVGLSSDSAAPGQELKEAVARLIDAQVRGGRLEVLIDKARQQPLNDVEKQELQALSMGPLSIGPLSIGPTVDKPLSPDPERPPERQRERPPEGQNEGQNRGT
jgi:DNA primase